MVTPDLSIDLNPMKAKMDLGLHQLGIANSQLGTKKHLNLKRYVTSRFKCLCDDHNELNQFMFRGNVCAMTEHTMKINNIVTQSDRSSYQQGKQPFLGRGRGSHSGFYRGGSRYKPGGGGRGQGGFHQRGSRGGGNSSQGQNQGSGHSQRGCQQQLDKAMKVMKPHIPKVGRLRFFQSQWQNLTSDPDILDTVSGMHINLKDLLNQKDLPKPLKLSPKEIAAADSQLSVLLKKQAIKHRHRGESGKFISNVFLHPKKDRGFRCIPEPEKV